MKNLWLTPRPASCFLVAFAGYGFTNVMDVAEGMFGRGKTQPGWLKRGLPVEPCLDCGP